MGAAVIGAGEGDSAAAPGCRAGDLHRVLHRFRPGGDQQGFLGEITGHLLIHLFAQRQIRLIGQHLEAGMRQLFQLVFCKCIFPTQLSVFIIHTNTAPTDESIPAEFIEYR